MRLIMDRLREKSLALAELESLVCKSQTDKIGRRTIQNYLAELRALGLVNYDSQTLLYEWAENKREFENRHDYDVALKHSKNLLFSTSEKQRLDQMDPFLALDLIVFHDRDHSRDMDDTCLFQHLQSGYSDIFALVEKYRKMMDDKGLSERQGFPKISGDWHADLPSELVVSASALTEDNVRKAYVEGEISERENFFSSDLRRRGIEDHPLYSEKEKAEVIELFDLRGLLVGKIYYLANQVHNGIPLKGSCSCCPHRFVSIKGKQ